MAGEGDRAQLPPKHEPAPAPSKAPTPAPAVADAGPGAAPPGGQGLATRPPAKGPEEEVAGEMDLFDQPKFVPTGPVAEALEQAAAHEKYVPIRARFGKLSSGGVIHVLQHGRGSKPKHWTLKSKHDTIPLDHPFLAPIASADPVLKLELGKEGVITGHATLKSLGEIEKAFTDPKYGEALGLVGFHVPSIGLKNELKDGHLTLATNKPAKVTLGGWLALQLSVEIADTNVTLTADGDINIKAASGHFTVTRDPKGVYTGVGELAVTLGKAASGSAKATYQGGHVSIEGVIKFSSEKFSGSITVLFGDAAELSEKARQQVDPASLIEPPADAKTPKPKRAKKGDKGLAGWGEVDFAFTDWFTGKAKIIVSPEGYITVVGKIAPPKSFTLMDEKVWNKRLFGVDVTARYGLPYVADIHVGISAELGATARIGPAILTDIVVEGMYSTDPLVANAFSISGAFRLSAYAGLTLRFEGKAGLTILGHDIDVGAGITGKAGVKGYAEARPTIGYREKADPQAGKKGEYYVKGHLEIAAQPFLGLSGDLFVKLDSPWWSPAPDKTWTWDLFSLEYPLPGEFGLAADVDYVIGSGQMPNIEFGKASFDASKFTDSLMDDNIPKKSVGGDVGKAAKWQGEPTVPPPAAPPKPMNEKAKPPGKEPPKKGTPKTGSRKGKQSPEEAANTPKTADASKRWLEGMQALAALHEKAEKAPEDENEIHTDLEAIRTKFGFTSLTATDHGDEWFIDAEMNPSTKKAKKKSKKTARKKKKAKQTKPAQSSVKAPAATATPAPAPGTVHIDAFLDRPPFRPSTKKAVPITSSQDRRHIDAWQAMHEHLKLHVNGKPVAEAYKYMQSLKPPPGQTKAANYTPSAVTEAAIKAAGVKWLRDYFNALENLWAGDSEDNQEKGRTFGQAMERARKAMAAGDRTAFERELAIVEANWHDPDPTGAKKGFPGMVTRTIALLRQEFASRNPGK